MNKKTRFEVFKRDDFTCRYCGKKPPEVILEVDHIIPRKEGGEDDMANLITACFDCNRGKAAIPLSERHTIEMQAIELEKDELRHEQIEWYREMLAKRAIRTNGYLKEISGHYGKLRGGDGGWRLVDRFLRSTVKRYLKHLVVEEIKDAMDIAVGRIRPVSDDEWETMIRYFCGVCKNMIKDRRPQDKGVF